MLPRSPALLAACIFAVSCVAAPNVNSYTDDLSGGIPSAAAGRAEDLWAMTLMAGRYGVMLGTAREILGLPAPRADGASFPGEDQDEMAQRSALAEEQVRLAAEYFADAAAVCVKPGVPKTVLAIACQQDAEAPTLLLKRAALDSASLEARNEALGYLIMPWWDAACDYAAVGGASRMDVCPME